MDELDSVGKRCFVNCFEAAMRNGGKLRPDEIVENDPKVGRAPAGLDIRENYIRQIFASNMQCDALRICANARIEPEVKEKARKLLRQYCT